MAVVAQELCFAEGTPVWTEDGPRPIEKVEAGERVWAYDFHEQRWKLCVVVKTYARDYDDDLVEITIADDDGGYETVHATAEHPFWVVADSADRASRPTVAYEGGTPSGGFWSEAQHLSLGDRLLMQHGKSATVVGLLVRNERLRVYNLNVERLHNYAVGLEGYLVHNKCSRQVGSYTNTHQSGKKYHGKGSEERARRSGRRIANKHDDLLIRTEWTPASNDRDAFIQEAIRIAKDRGVSNRMNYNLINSPGERWR